MYDSIISLENLLGAWKDFLKGKRSKDDVQKFQYQLSDNLLSLHSDLLNKKYAHGGYYAFNISDPKPRNIHKANVRDRLLHHAIYHKLYPFFDPKFIHDSYSCRKWKGTHKAIQRFKTFANKRSKNNTRTLWMLKCDIRKFFESIDHGVLITILKSNITDMNVIDLLSRVITSFHSTEKGKGLPLGNLTSQLLVNVYMNTFDQFIKHKLKVKHYIRYADDFVLMHEDKDFLKDMLQKMQYFLKEKLKLDIHPHKTHLKTYTSGVDFLGWINFPDHRVLRTNTKHRMFKKMKDYSNERAKSYLGLLSHGNAKQLQAKIEALQDADNYI
jgi:retron-type reverse transcriptase